MDHRDNLIRHLMDPVRCSVCSASYAYDDVRVLGRQDELWFLTVTCPSCQTQGLIAALVRGGARAADEPESRAAPGAHMPEQLIDEGRPPAGAPVDESDVAAMREFLADFHGDLAALLARR